MAPHGVGSRRLVAPDRTGEGVWTYEPSHEPPPEPVGTCPGGTPDMTPELRHTVGTSPLRHKNIQYFTACPQQLPSPNGISCQEYGLPFDRSQAAAKLDLCRCDPVSPCAEAKSPAWPVRLGIGF